MQTGMGALCHLELTDTMGSIASDTHQRTNI